VKAEIGKVATALTKVGVASTLRFDGVGESGTELVKLLDEASGRVVRGEAILRVAGRHTLRFTLVSPSSLTAHLSQATLVVLSISQLTQLLSSEIERYLLSIICDLGRSICSRVNGTWFVDQVKGRSVGRWEGCVV
jgi:mediator of RNA polymerase II transcription subunit 17